VNNVTDQIGETIIREDEADEAKRLRGRQLDDALYAALLSRCHSDEAHALVDTVTALVTEHEIAAATRTNKRNKKKLALRLAVERLLADLLQAQASDTNKGYVYRPLRPEAFTGQAVSYRTFKSLVDVMLTLGLLEEYKGFQGWSDGFGAPVPWIRKATRYRATEALLGIFHQHSIKAADFHQHFLIPLPDNPLRLWLPVVRDDALWIGDGELPWATQLPPSWVFLHPPKPVVCLGPTGLGTLVFTCRIVFAPIQIAGKSIHSRENRGVVSGVASIETVDHF